jgi:proline iminopeptidase
MQHSPKHCYIREKSVMRRTNLNWIVSLFLVVSLISGCFHSPGARQGLDPSNGLFPEIQPFQTGFLRVSNLHEIFYQLSGNPKGKPVMVLHGGPGAGCTPWYFRFFNPEKFNIVLHDQRGSGKSKPYAEIKENNTQTLVEDIEKLRKHLGLDKVLLFGGSWGSTLALAYAEAYPQNVLGIVLRGVFLATKEEIQHYYHGGTARYFPETYQKLREAVADPERMNYPEKLRAKLLSPDSTQRAATARAWAVYEGKIAYLQISDEKIEKWFSEGWNPYAMALLENHYMANACFLKEGELLDRAGRLANIPVTIVNGRYDVICPPITAYRLHQNLPGSKLVIAEASGHSADEPAVTRALVQAVKEFE